MPEEVRERGRGRGGELIDVLLLGEVREEGWGRGSLWEGTRGVEGRV